MIGMTKFYFRIFKSIISASKHERIKKSLLCINTNDIVMNIFRYKISLRKMINHVWKKKVNSFCINYYRHQCYKKSMRKLFHNTTSKFDHQSQIKTLHYGNRRFLISVANELINNWIYLTKSRKLIRKCYKVYSKIIRRKKLNRYFKHLFDNMDKSKNKFILDRSSSYFYKRNLLRKYYNRISSICSLRKRFDNIQWRKKLKFFTLWCNIYSIMNRKYNLLSKVFIVKESIAMRFYFNEWKSNIRLESKVLESINRSNYKLKYNTFKKFYNFVVKIILLKNEWHEKFRKINKKLKLKYFFCLRYMSALRKKSFEISSISFDHYVFFKKKRYFFKLQFKIDRVKRSYIRYYHMKR